MKDFRNNLMISLATDWIPDPGISHFEDNPSQAAKSLEPYMEFAKDMVPEIEIPHTPVYLGATAGMRMLRSVLIWSLNVLHKEIGKKSKVSSFILLKIAACFNFQIVQYMGLECLIYEFL